jgi:hypothetical protein
MSENLSVSGSARRRLLVQLNTGNLAAVHRPDFISRSRLRLVNDLRMKRAPNEKECRALTLSRRRPSASNSSSSSSSNEASRLPQSITARDTGSRKVERRDNQKKRHRQVSNNFVAINTSGSGTRKLRSRFFSSPSDAGSAAAFDSFAPAQLTFQASRLNLRRPAWSFVSDAGRSPSNK